MRKIYETKSDRIFNFVNTGLLSFLLVLMLYPLVYILSASVSNPDMINQGKMWLFPRDITFEGYRRVFQNVEIWNGYKNTIFYTLAGTGINLLVTLPAAYALSRKDLLGRNIFVAIFTFTMFFSGGLIPTYLLVSGLGLRNTVWALLLPGAASMWNIIISRTFFQTNLPVELKEAAEMDGCTNTRLFMVIVLPLSKPIIAVMALFYGVGHWNAFFGALIYISNEKLYPLQLILREILIQLEMDLEMMKTGNEIDYLAKQVKAAEIIKYAVIIVSTVPVMLAYPFIQKYFVKGVMVGAIKG